MKHTSLMSNKGIGKQTLITIIAFLIKPSYASQAFLEKPHTSETEQPELLSKHDSCIVAQAGAGTGCCIVGCILCSWPSAYCAPAAAEVLGGASAWVGAILCMDALNKWWGPTLQKQDYSDPAKRRESKTQ